MATLKQIILASGLGLAGLVQDVQAADVVQDTGPHVPTHAEVRKNLYDHATRVSYDTWKPQVLDYDGAVVVLFNSSCNQTQQADDVDRNMELVFTGLANRFEDAKVNGLPLRFEVYDVCGKSKTEFLGIKGSWPQTHMYLDGKLIDAKIGGPKTEATIPNTIRASSAWIDSNLLAIPYVKDGQDMRVVYNGTTNSTLEPYKQN